MIKKTLKDLIMGWLIYALLAAIFAALTAIFAKIGLNGINSDFATFIRTVFIVAITAAWVSYLGKWQSFSSITAKQWLFLFLSAAATGFSWLFYFKALQMGSASHVAPVDKLSVVFVAVFAFIFLGEKLNLREMGGLALIVIGVLVLTYKPAAKTTSASSLNDQESKVSQIQATTKAPTKETTEQSMPTSWHIPSSKDQK
ncbi:EamA family transporter [Psittacicella hinzii]|nr:EamA family transporter [Psittacicella hinzii]